MTDMTPEQALEWLESLHATDENGAVTADKWADAQAAAKAFRAALSRPAVPADLKQAFSVIEDEIAGGQLTAAQVFTRMRTAVQSATPVPAVPEDIREFIKQARCWLDSRAETAKPGWMVHWLPRAEAMLTAAPSAQAEKKNSADGLSLRSRLSQIWIGSQPMFATPWITS